MTGAAGGEGRCSWASGGDEQYRRYHDEEWGRPVTGDAALFERLVLEGFQAGLSWATILNLTSDRWAPEAHAPRARQSSMQRTFISSSLAGGESGVPRQVMVSPYRRAARP